MKINLNTKMLTLYGKPIVENKENFILKDIFVSSLMGTCQGDEKETNDQKVKRFELSLKILQTVDEIDLEVKDIELINKCIEKRIPPYTPLIVGQAIKLLGGQETGIVLKEEDE